MRFKKTLFTVFLFALTINLPLLAQAPEDLLAMMAQDKVDFTILFRQLCDFSIDDNASNSTIRDLFLRREAFDAWAIRYRQRLKQQELPDEQRALRMKQVNPRYVLRNYMAEVAIRKAEDEKDYSEIDRLISLLQSPFEDQPEYDHYAGFPPDWASNIAVSCSS